MTPERHRLTRRVLLFTFVALIAAAAWVGGRSVQPRRSWAPPSTTTGDAPRIVALSPALAITLKDLGLADRIVGRHGFDLALDPTIPVCGDQNGIDYEALIRTHPTHVLTEWGTREIPARLAHLAAANDWILRDYTQLKLDDVIDNTLKLGLEFAQKDDVLIHRPGDAETPRTDRSQQAYERLIERMQSAWLKGRPKLSSGRILLLESIDPPAALGPGSYHHQILERIGGTPAITTGKPYMPLDAEDILRMAPDGIILLLPRGPRTAAGPSPIVDELRTRLGRLGTLDIPAIRRGRIALIDDPFCLTPSTALLNVSEELERILKGWAP